MSIEKFTDDELVIRETGVNFRGQKTQIFSTPITPRENYSLLYGGKTPMWIPYNTDEMAATRIDCDPEDAARSPSGGIDGYGVEWIWVDVAGGAMVRPGAPKVPDITHWEDYITVPDPDSWDWEASYERNKHKFSPDKFTFVSTSSCLFERMIAVMDFAEAAMALIDDEQKESVHRFLRAITDVKKKFYKNCKKYYHADMVNFNDDWGSQRAEFFSYNTAREMLFPYVKELGDYVHSLGMYFDLHSCGFVESLVPLFVEEGFNSWGGQPMNDKSRLKKEYGDKMLFTFNVPLTDESTNEDVDRILDGLFADMGEDNRVLIACPVENAYFRKQLYARSRMNYDRLVAEGKAVL